jgi:uncharacterized membrane protein (UPF0127 family)
MILNATKKKCISKNPYYARNFFIRGRGMIGRDFSDFDAMVFERCNSIHTLFMGINIDVLFVDRDNRVCDLCGKLPPWRPVVRCGSAYTVIELPEGAIERTGTEKGDILDLNAELCEPVNKKLLESELLQSAETVIPLSSETNG